MADGRGATAEMTGGEAHLEPGAVASPPDDAEAPPEAAPAGRAPPRVDALDGLRGLAAVCIALVFHYRHFFDPDAQPPPWFFDFAVFAPLLRYGFLAVDLFFGISGFIMTLVYYESIRDGRVAGARFAMLRLSRLWPLHAVTTLAAGVLGFGYFLQAGAVAIPGASADDAYHLLLTLLMMQHVGLEFSQSFNFVSWSLSVEALCYVLFFLIARQGGYFDLLCLLLFSIGIFLLFNRISTLFLTADTGRGLVGFFAGCLIARGFMSGHSRPLAVGAWGFLAFYAITCLLPHAPGDVMAADPRLQWQTVVFPALIAACLTTRPLRDALSTPPLAWAGRLSYSIYLCHIPVQYGLFIAFKAAGRPVPYDRLRFYALYVLLVVSSSVATNLLIERPAQARLRRWWEARREQRV